MCRLEDDEPFSFGQVFPARSRVQNPENGVQNVSVVGSLPSSVEFPRWGRWKQRLDLFPLGIRQGFVHPAQNIILEKDS
jgi:hypothetical protein